MKHKKVRTHKKVNRASKKSTRKKRTQSGGKKEKKVKKEQREKVKPGKISKILSNLYILFSFPSIEYLPSSEIFRKEKAEHYLQMVNFEELANVVNLNSKYKRSPTIQKIFNYRSYRLESEDEIVFNYNFIRCDNLLVKEQKNYNVKLLFLYLLECNVGQRLQNIIQSGGDKVFDIENLIEYNQGLNKKTTYEDIQREEEEKEFQKERDEEIEMAKEIERLRFNERIRLEEEHKKEEDQGPSSEDESSGEDDISDEEDKLEELEDKKDEFHDEIEDKIDDLDDEIEEKQELDEENIKNESIEKEKRMKEENEQQKQMEIKLKGFEQYLASRKIKTQSNNNFAMYNVNWFNVCSGVEMYDDGFEAEVIQNLNEMGIVINVPDIRNKIIELLNDKDELVLFQKMIKSRLLDCSEVDPPNFFQKLFTNSFGTFKKCDKREPQSLLYLYDEYKAFLERNINLSKVDRVLILIFCETRQQIFSKYVSLEILRKENEGKKKEKVIEILDKILHADKNAIKRNEKLLEKQTKMKYSTFKKKRLAELNQKKRIFDNQNDPMIDYQENKLERLRDNDDRNLFDKVKGLFNREDKPSSNFDIALTPKERVAYEKAIRKMKGGGTGSNYDLTLKKRNELCKKIEDESNIYENQLGMINHCFN